MHERLMSGYYQTGLVGDIADQPFLFADSSGMHVKLRPNRRVQVRGWTFATDGDGVTVPIAPNTSGSTRIDRPVLRLYKSDGDYDGWLVQPEVVQGTPGSGAPAFATDEGDTGTWDLVLGEVTIPTGTTTSITPGMVGARSMYLGSQLLLADADNLAPGGNLPRTFLRYRADNDSLALQTDFGATAGRRYLYVDTGWVNLTGTSGSGWSSTSTASAPHRVRRRDGWVSCRVGNFDRSGGSVSIGTDVRLPGTLPSGYRTSEDILAMGMYANTVPCRVVIYSESHPSRANQLWIIQHGGITAGNVFRGCHVAWPVEG